jgi:hypothetical protein
MNPCGRLGGDVTEMVHRLQDHAAALRGQVPQRQGER